MFYRCLLAAGAATLLSTSAWAGGVYTMINIAGDTAASTEGLGSFTGVIMYDDTAKHLKISLTNTSAPANGGFITGLVFNILGDASATYQPIGGDTFQGVTNESAAPFGTFEFGAAIGGNFQGGGNPNTGVAAGDTRIFEFNVTGPDAGSLVASDFFSEYSSSDVASLSRKKKPSSDPQLFAVRFKGFQNGGSDKVPGTSTVVPTPSASLAGLVGLGAMGLWRRRRR